MISLDSFSIEAEADFSFLKIRTFVLYMGIGMLVGVKSIINIDILIFSTFSKTTDLNSSIKVWIDGAIFFEDS